MCLCVCVFGVCECVCVRVRKRVRRLAGKEEGICRDFSEFVLGSRAERQGKLVSFSELLWKRFLGYYILLCTFNTDLYLEKKLYF